MKTLELRIVDRNQTEHWHTVRVLCRSDMLQIVKAATLEHESAFLYSEETCVAACHCGCLPSAREMDKLEE